MQGRRLRRRRLPLRLIIFGIAATALIFALAARYQAEVKGRVTAPTAPTAAPTATPYPTPTPPQETPVNNTPAAEKEPEWEPDEAEVAYIAKTIFGEAGVVRSKARRAAVGWCILNRVDSPTFPDTVEAVVTAPAQFHGYREDCEPPESYYELARDILTRYHREQQGEADAGRTLPQGYLYFWGDGKENHFTKDWLGKDYWNWSLPDPYETHGKETTE